MTRILVIEELNTHAECVTLFLDLFKDKTWISDEYLLDPEVLTSLKISKKNTHSFEDKLFNLTKKIDQKIVKKFYTLKNYLTFIKRAFYIRDYIKKSRPDFILINTINFFPNLPMILFLMRRDLKGKLILMLHDTYLGGDTITKERITNFLLRRLIKKTDSRIVILAKYLNKHYLGGNKVFYLNNQRFQKPSDRKNKITTFSIIGREKNYSEVFDAFSKTNRKDFRINIFVRTAKDLELLKKDLKIFRHKKNVRVFFNSNYEEMHEECKKSHYLLCPLKKIDRFGEYRSTGNYGDSLAMNLPIILPDWYAPNYNFGKNIIRYSDLSKIIDNLIDLKGYVLRLKDLKKEIVEYEKSSGEFLNFLKNKFC